MLIEQVIEFEWGGLGPMVIGVARRPGDLAPIKILFMTKMGQKSLLFLQFQFLLLIFAYNAFF